ncbi:3-dehydroquinate synthase, partial [mine drainage metagenome]
LNLGHTFGHAIETGLGYGNWLHGEAVAVGSLLAADLSERLGWLHSKDLQRMTTLFERTGLPTQAPNLGVQRYLDLMAGDKKAEAGSLRFVLLKSLGQARLTSVTRQDLLEAVLTPGQGRFIAP